MKPPLVTEWIDLNKELIKCTHSTYGITAADDAPEFLISSGDLLIVDSAETPRNGAIVIVQVGDEFFYREYRMQLALVDDPPPPVFGVVTHRIHSYGKGVGDA